MNNILEQRDYFKQRGLYPIPVLESKKPLTKNGAWKDVKDWTDQDFIQAGGIGIEHEKSKIIDIDFDDPDAIKFQHLLPNTFGLGKKINGFVMTTHLFYHTDFKCKKTTYLSDRNKKDSVIVEVLTNTQTVSAGHGRLITNDAPIRKLTESEYDNVMETVRKISLLTMLSKYYPKEGGRDEFCLILAGCLTKGNDWPTWEREDFLKELLLSVGDTDDLKNRLNKITYQEEQRKLNKDITGLPSLAKEISVPISVCVDWFNWIGVEKLEDTTPITALSIGDFIGKNYPPQEYWVYPLVSKQTITQIWASPGVGKTLFSMELACSLANGQDFLKYKWVEETKPVPVLYVEGEMSAQQIQDRVCNITSRYAEEGKEFNFDYLRIAPVQEQLNQHFDPLNEDLGRKRLELQLEQMKESFGQYPVLFLDNISCLTSFQEKDGEAWITFMQWLIKLRARGYTIFFLHHATKEGSTSSGSNMKERSVDIEIKLSEPTKEQKLDINETQMIIEFKKWREFNYTEHSHSFLASVSRHTAKWSWHKVNKKMNEKEESFNFWYIKEGVRSWSEDMKDHLIYPISKAQFYKYKKGKDEEILEQLTTNKEI
jgi:KaiC/GvpD/RAD55 family RecA-like ATPase